MRANSEGLGELWEYASSLGNCCMKIAFSCGFSLACCLNE